MLLSRNLKKKKKKKKKIGRGMRGGGGGGGGGGEGGRRLFFIDIIIGDHSLHIKETAYRNDACVKCKGKDQSRRSCRRTRVCAFLQYTL